MKEELLRTYYAKRGFSDLATEGAVSAVKTLENALMEKQRTLEEVTVADIREHVKTLIATDRNTIDHLQALARYFYLTDRKDIYIYFTSLTGGYGVIDSITDRLGRIVDKATAETVSQTVVSPPLGTEPHEYPDFTRDFMRQLDEKLPSKTVCQILAGNNHGVPREVFLQEKANYEKADSLDEFLSDYHRRKVAELQEFCDQKKVWYEQTISQNVVDFVAANQEILSAVRQGDCLYVTKIPYDPDTYLKTEDPVSKRYLACHCPFVKEAIKQGRTDISPHWCYCSAGFEKFPFEVILDQEMSAEVLQSALQGDALCRFAIHLPSK